MTTRSILIDTKIEALEDIKEQIEMRIEILKGMKEKDDDGQIPQE